MSINFRKTLQKIRRNKYSFFAILFCVILFAKQSNDQFNWWDKNKNENLNLSTDGSGYYAYLPATFIYKDFRFQFLNEISAEYKTTNFINGTDITAKKNEIVDKYFVGTSICISPFFLTTHFVNKVFSKKADGYSKTYRMAVSISTIFYFVLGILAIILFLKLYKIQDWIIAFVILAISLGTSLNFYTVYYPAFSHVYSFFAISWFIYLSKKFAIENSRKRLFYIFVFISLIFLIRPTNIIVLLIFPFLFDSFKAFLQSMKYYFINEKVFVFLLLFLSICLCSLQFISVYLQTGSFFIDTYSNEKFSNLFSPKLFEVLFSYKKGLFVYAPVLFILFPAYYFLFKANRFLFWGHLITLFCVLYLTASWWCWWYGGGLGMRPFVDFSILFALPIALMIKNSTKLIKFSSILFLISTIYIYSIFQSQFNRNILHYDLMKKSTFWNVFLKTDLRYSWHVFFETDKISKKDIVSKKKYFYNNKTKDWNTKKCSSSFDYGIKNQDLDIYFIYKKEKSNNNKIAFKIGAEYKIFNPKTNPGFNFKYYSNGKLILLKNYFIGSKIDEFNKSTFVEFTLISTLKTKDFDSVKVEFIRNIKPSAIKDLKIEILSLQK